MSETPEMPTNPAMLKLAGAALGGYVLGRFKKGRKAVGLAMWLAGGRAGLDPKMLAREGLMTLANSPEGKQLITQLRGPMLEAGKHVAAATFESQMASLTKALESRTAAL